MDLSTRYLGLRLKHPLIVGASPMVDDLGTVRRDELMGWMVEHGYDSVAQMKGCMSLARCPDPAAYERANYVQILQTWRAPAGW